MTQTYNYNTTALNVAISTLKNNFNRAKYSALIPPKLELHTR